MRVALLAACLAACSPASTHRISVATITIGDRAKTRLEPTAITGLELVPLELPPPAAPIADEVAVVVARARTAYTSGDFDACRSALAQVDIGKLLLARKRALASRALAFDAACAYGARAPSIAQGIAAKLARMGLELPDAAFAPDEERVLTNALAAAGSAPRHRLSVTGLDGALLAIDGAPAGCTLPCTIDLTAGDHHVVVEADGYTPLARWIAVTQTATERFELRPASPELALAQWRARIGRGLAPADPVGARLLARSSGRARLAFLSADERIAGTLIIDGKIAAVGARDQAAPLLRDLAYDGGVLVRPAIWQRPTFWIVTSVAVAAIAGAIVYAIYEPDVESRVGF